MSHFRDQTVKAETLDRAAAKASRELRRACGTVNSGKPKRTAPGLKAQPVGFFDGCLVGFVAGLIFVTALLVIARWLA